MTIASAHNGQRKSNRLKKAGLEIGKVVSTLRALRVMLCDSFNLTSLLAALLMNGWVGLCENAIAHLDHEQEPIAYSRSQPVDRISRLSTEVREGRYQLEWDDDHGYLKSILKALQIPLESQCLVFSQTSLQNSRISPSTPRAIYFADDVYVGWVQGGETLELSAADPQLGGTFYTISQRQADRPVIQRETGRCLQCHGSTHTRRIPGHFVRSVFPDSEGRPILRLGTRSVVDSTPFSERWGGWYVTGEHGSLRHQGNLTVPEDTEDPEDVDREPGANTPSLMQHFPVDPYLSEHSDLIALMVLVHQVTVHNAMTSANHSGRIALRDAAVLEELSGADSGTLPDSIVRRLDLAAESVVRAILLKDARFEGFMKGSSRFAEVFSGNGHRDSRGRSLKDLDLEHRLFRYPCSYLIDSDAFRGLPDDVRLRVLRRLSQILLASAGADEHVQLTNEDRKAIHEILVDTIPEYAAVASGTP